VPTASGSPTPSAASGRAIDREVVRLALPSLGALLAPPLFLLADAVIVGRLGPAPLAGLGLAGAVITTVTGLSVFLAYGTTGAVARLLGAGDVVAAVRHGISAMWLALGIGVAAAVVGWTVTTPVVSAFGAPADATEQAETYLRVGWWGIPALLVSLASTGVLRGLQDTRTPLLVAAAGALGNLLLNVALVLGLDMGIAGAAAGTVIAEVAMAAALSVVVARGARAQGVGLRPHGTDVSSSWRTGWPLLVRTAAMRVALLAATAAAARLGTTGLAAFNVAFVVWGLLALALDALAIAAQALVGRYLGSGDPDSVRTLTTRLVRWGVLGGAVLGLTTAALAVPIAPLFTDDADVARLLLVALLVVAVLQPLAGWVFVLDGILIGAGDGRYLALAAIGATVAFLPLAVLAVQASSWGDAAGMVALWFAIGGWMLVRLATLAPRARSPRWIVTGSSRSATRAPRPRR
jgi:putative MATE family efflux protein